MNKSSRSSQSAGDVVRLSRLYGCGVPGLKKVSKASKRHKSTKSAFAYNNDDLEKVNQKLKSSDFFISNGVASFEGFDNYYIPLMDLKDIFETSFRVKFSSSEIAAFVQEYKCTELDSFREIKIIFNHVLKELKLLGNTLRSQNQIKIREDNEALLEFRLKHVEGHEEDHQEVHLDPPIIFNTLWEIHDACREHWDLKTKKFMDLLHNNFNTPTGCVDGDKLREFLWYNIDAKVTAEHCKMLILYINGMVESRLANTVAIHLIVKTLKLLAQDRQCLLTPPADDEESYHTFCEAVHKIQMIITDESRTSRIMNRSMKIVSKREEKNRKKQHNVVPMDPSHLAPVSMSSSDITRNNENNDLSRHSVDVTSNILKTVSKLKNNIKKNTAALEPIFEKGKKGKTEKQVESSPSNKENKKKKKAKAVGFSSPVRNSTQNGKQLGSYVAHSTGVSNPGGASSILRAKTPLIIDRPSNIRDRMNAAVGGVVTVPQKDTMSDDGSTTSSMGGGGKNSSSCTTTTTTKKRETKEHRLELCPVQLDEKGQGLRYDLRYRVLATFTNVLSGTRKVSLEDVLQAFWAKKQCEIGIGLDIMSESGVIVDRNTFVEVLGIILPKFLDANTLFSALDPNRSGFIAIHTLHALVNLYFLKIDCTTSDIVEAVLRAATWEILNCRVHVDPSIRSTLSTASKANNAAQMAAKRHLEENATEMKEKELQVKLGANNTRMKEHLRKRVEAELIESLSQDEEDAGAGVDVDDSHFDYAQHAQREAAAIRGAFLPPGILNACVRAICTSPETEKQCSLSLFIMIKKGQAENIWNEHFTREHRGYTREDVSVGFAVDYLSDNEDEGVFLKEELLKMHAKVSAHTKIGLSTNRKK